MATPIVDMPRHTTFLMGFTGAAFATAFAGGIYAFASGGGRDTAQLIIYVSMVLSSGLFSGFAALLYVRHLLPRIVVGRQQ